MKPLTEQRDEVWGRMDSMYSEGVDSWTDVQTNEYEELETQHRSLTRKIEAAERFSQINKPQGSPITVTPNTHKDSEARHIEAFNRWALRGESALTPEDFNYLQPIPTEQRAMSTGVNSEGGFLIPTNVRAAIQEALKAFGGLRSVSTVLTTNTGADLVIPKNDDTGNVGEIVNENTDVADQDLSFTAVTLGAHIYSSKAIIVPVSLLEDSLPDLGAYIGRKIRERIARLQASHWVRGSGSGQPQGLLLGRDTTKDVTTNAALSYNNLVDVVHQVDPAYRALPGTAFLMNDQTLAQLEKLVDGQDRPLWVPSMREASPGRLFGWPVIIDQAMPNHDVAATPDSAEISVAFGNFAESYTVREVRSIEVLRLSELRARFRQVVFLGFQRADGDVINSQAFACIRKTA